MSGGNAETNVSLMPKTSTSVRRRSASSISRSVIVPSAATVMRLPLASVQEAFEIQAAGDSGKVVLEVADA